MSEFDFAVAGSTPGAVLLALCLAQVHGKKICLAGEIPHSLHLTRGLDLRVGLSTRPDTWRLITDNVDDTLALAQTVAHDAWTRTDVAFPAATSAGAVALGHVRYMAMAYGIATEPLVDSHGTNVPGFMARSVLRLQRRRFYEEAKAALANAGVTVCAPDGLRMNRSGTNRVRMNDGDGTAATVVLADDAEVIRHGLARRGDRIAYRALLTEPDTHLAWPCVVDMEAGGEAYAHPNGAVECIARTDTAPARTWLAQQLAPGATTRLAGRSSFERLQRQDGAPVFRAARKNLIAVWGTGLAGLFLTPSIGRWLTGNCTDSEQAFFAARSGGKAPKSDTADLPGGTGASV